MAPPIIAALAATDDSEERTYRKVTWRLVPFLCLCFVIAFLGMVFRTHSVELSHRSEADA
ncbi:hypothetical protein DOT67_24945 [Ralstonia pseudosolanacearum]|uniref:MFS transporter n=1 Tax=Ralstonia pseudosolanacearum TaxID=1310165 RepID=A0A454TIM1_9RALS|nr:hypothetical protein DOT67_24945 [Ralstonia pseudosolanacearum]RNM00027.1 hypothetical protein EGA29_25355 [Ralstonia pseudosolanacearum]